MLNRHNCFVKYVFSVVQWMDVFYVSVLPSEKDATSATRCFLLVTNLESYFFANRQLFVKRQSFSREETYSNIYFITNIRLLRWRKKMKINLFTYHFNMNVIESWTWWEIYILSIMTTQIEYVYTLSIKISRTTCK